MAEPPSVPAQPAKRPHLGASASFVGVQANGVLEAGESAMLRITVRNDGDGDARRVTATLSASGVTGVEVARDVSFGDITAKTERFVDAPVRGALTTTAGALSVTAIFREANGDAPQPLTATIRVRLEDVEKNLPLAKSRNPYGVAVVFGVEGYSQARAAKLPSVAHAVRDATWVREYVLQTFGFEPSNVLYQTDGAVTKGEFDRVFEEGGWLERRVRTLGAADVFVYFAGHGAPFITSDGARPILIPYDGDPNYAAQTCYRLDDILARLAALKARTATVVLDTCFSGGGRAGREESPRLVAQARETYWDVDPVAKAGIAVFSAASGTQWSSSYPSAQHGLFTYFWLRGIRGDADSTRDSRITVGELDSYLTRTVPKAAFELYEREQTPTLQATDSVKARALVELAAKP